MKARATLFHGGWERATRDGGRRGSAGFPERAFRTLGIVNDSLAPALLRNSSRLAPPPTPAISMFVHVGAVVVWVSLFLLAFGFGGVFAWVIGLAYLIYDVGLQVFTGWQIRRFTRAEPIRDDGVRNSLAVVVAAHNEATVLPATLDALLTQGDPPDEILIADDGSDDDTAAVLVARFGFVTPDYGASCARALAGSTSIVWLRQTHGGKARALNAAIVTATSDIVMTVDADTVLEPGAIRAVRRSFSAEPELAGITGIITPVCRPTRTGQVLQWFQTYEYIRNFLGRHAWERVDCLQLISGAFAGFRRGAVVDVGGFDDACLVEDYELVHRMRRHAGEHDLDWRFRVLGDARARTEAPGSVPAFLRQRRRWFGGFLQTQWWYRAMIGDRRLGRLGTLMLPIKSVDTVAPLYGLTALALLLVFVATGRVPLWGPVVLVIVGKLAIDVVFRVWSVRRYQRWVGDSRQSSLVSAAVSAVLEPITFALLLQVGALLGWVAFLGGAQRWGTQQRHGTLVGEPPPPA